MYDSLLLPTDGSAGMASAITHCFQVAQQSEAPVHALYVVDMRAYVMLPKDTRGQVKQVLVNEGERTLSALVEHADEEGVTLEPALVEGIPHEVIVQFAAEQEVALIVMGTHGRSGEQHRIVGSVAEEVVRNATVPVMTTRARKEDVEAVQDVVVEEPEEEIAKAQRRYIS